jgi:hypothetical protein
MPKGDIETYYTQASGKWHNRVEAGADLAGTHDRKEDAVAAGRTEAQSRKVEHIIRNQDGTIGERNSYGHDPRNIPG